MDKKVSAISITRTLSLLIILTLFKAMAPVPALASDLPLAAGSPLAGFSFDDRPLLLPIQRNFQMAMLTAGSELGRTCGKMEAYGWRMSAAEQQRVNQIFNNTVDRLRGLGYSIEAQAPSSVSKDITMFTADRPDKHFLFMWSAGEIGLVMTLCETASPLGSRHVSMPHTSVETYPQDVVQSKLDTPTHESMRPAPTGKFTPIGNWAGGYICGQGYTGATLRILRLRNDNFEGEFRFYPTAKNLNVPNGSFTVYGQYDAASQRILINPGKWIKHPKGYFSTVMIGSFDSIARTFSAYFQGVSGCTSFEAKYISGAPKEAAVSHKTKKKRVKKAATKQTVTPAPAVAAQPAAPGKPESGLAIAPTTTGTTAPVAAPMATDAPASIVLPPANAPEPTPAPAAAPAPTPAPIGTTAPVAPEKHGSLLEPLARKIVLAASGQWVTPQNAIAPPPQQAISQAPPAPSPNTISALPQQVPLPQQAQLPTQVPPPDITPALPNVVPLPQQVPDLAPTDVRPQQAPLPVMYNDLPQQAPTPVKVPDPGSPPKP